MPSSPEGNVVAAPLSILNLPDLACAKSLTDLIQILANSLVALIPTSITNVTVGNVQPSDSQLGNFWIRKDNSGNFVGFYVFAQGLWRQIFPVADSNLKNVGIQRVFRLSADPTIDPPGYTRFDNFAGVDAAMVAFEVATWQADPLNPGFYLNFSVVYTGF